MMHFSPIRAYSGEWKRYFTEAQAHGLGAVFSSKKQLRIGDVVQVRSNLGGIHSYRRFVRIVRELTEQENAEWCFATNTAPLKRPYYYECEEIEGGGV